MNAAISGRDDANTRLRSFAAALRDSEERLADQPPKLVTVEPVDEQPLALALAAVKLGIPAAYVGDPPAGDRFAELAALACDTRVADRAAAERWLSGRS